MDNSNSGTVLIVDDDIGISELLRLLLDSVGIKTLIASNADCAVNLLRNKLHEIKVCLLDLNLGDTSGEKVYEQLRELSPNLAVFPMSGISMDEIRGKFENKEIAGIITKPFNTAHMIETVESSLKQESMTES